MSFIITIKNVPDKDLGPLLARLNLPKSAKYDVNYQPGHVGLLTGPNGKERKRMPSTSKLTMTGKKPAEGSKLALALDAFERLEAKKGIGTVSVLDLQEALKHKKQETALAQRLIKTGYVEYL